jgi:Flp pilus assembly protein TadD
MKITVYYLKIKERFLVCYSRSKQILSVIKIQISIYRGAVKLLLQKIFVRQNRRLVWGVLVLVAVLILGIIALVRYQAVEREKNLDHLALAREASAKNDLAAAEREYLVVLKTNDDKGVWLELGYVYQQEKKATEAIDAYQRSCHGSKNDASVYNMIGNMYRDLGKYDQAEEAYKKALELNSNLVPVVVNLGHLYTLEQKNDQALSLYLQYYDGTKVRGSVGLQLASLYLVLDKKNEAKRVVEQILAADPKNGQAQALAKKI